VAVIGSVKEPLYLCRISKTGFQEWNPSLQMMLIP
jgi:hypothetical protein